MVLRRIYLILKEIAPHMGVTLHPSSHDIEGFKLRGRPPPYSSGAPRVEEQPEVKPKEEVLIYWLEIMFRCAGVLCMLFFLPDT